MSLRVIIIHPEETSTQPLVSFFRQRGDQVQQATSPAEAHTFLQQNKPQLVFLDLHLSEDGWPETLDYLRQKPGDTKLVFITDYPDPQQEARIKKAYGTSIVLQQPFTRAGLEQALRALDKETQPSPDHKAVPANLPKVRIPVRIKITVPFVILALLLALAASYVVSQVVLDTVEERFTNQLIEAGKLANDWMVHEEDRLLETLRLVAHTRGVANAVGEGNAERLREIALPLAINYQEEAIEILDLDGTSILSLHHRKGGSLEEYDISRGETMFSQWPFVQSVLEHRVENSRDKFAGLAKTSWGDFVYVAGPILDDANKPVGAILVGKSLPTLVRQIRQDILANTTIYDFNGRPLVSSLLSYKEGALALNPDVVSEVLDRQVQESVIRPFSVASIDYTEIVGPWQVRKLVGSPDNPQNGHSLGLIGISLAETFLARPSQITRAQIFILTSVAFFLVIGLGVVVANRITGPLLRVVDASAQVARGNLNVQVEAGGDDEVAVLAHSFNEMVSGLQEGSMYRDLLGRTVSPEVREQLRHSFASGEVRLDGQDAEATVVISDIRGFTTLSEAEAPGTIMNWLNEYFGELEPVITAHDGVISKFEGDAVVAFFGILPRPLPVQESAYQACQAGLAMVEAVDRLNARRIERGDPPFTAGVGINTGPVTAGALGSADRLHYTIIGDTVNATARLEGLTRQFGNEGSVVISQHTLFALRDLRHEYELESLGAHIVKGKAEQLLAYRLQRATVTA